MQISSKHQNQSTTMLQSFVGGLNTSAPDEMIDVTQLAQCINMEINGTGQLRTVKGTRDVAVAKRLKGKLKAGAFDSINNVLVVFGKDGTAYSVQDGEFIDIGTLSGDSEVLTASWEDGMLVASGGMLQYGKMKLDPTTPSGYKYSLYNISTSPHDCGGVLIKSGRVLVFDDEDNVLYSGVGDEELWEQDSNDPSTSLFAQIGYKAGGRIIGMVAFNSYILFFKDNGLVYRLENEYPDWVIKQVSTSCLCKGKLAYTSIGSNVLVLGEKTLQSISPTDDYGNMPINYVGKQIENEIANLPPWTKMRFNTELNQLWFITGSQWVLVYDCNTQTFFQRYFNSDVVDMVGNYIIKKDRVSELVFDEPETMEDNNEPLYYRAKFKTEMGLTDILVKSVALNVSPLSRYYDGAEAMAKVSRIKIPFPARQKSNEQISKRTVGVTNTAINPASSNADVQKNAAYNEENVSPGKSMLYKKRQVCRDHRIEVELEGKGFPFILNFISYDKVGV